MVTIDKIDWKTLDEIDKTMKILDKMGIKEQKYTLRSPWERQIIIPMNVSDYKY